jgi:hypothetical protein
MMYFGIIINCLHNFAFQISNYLQSVMLLILNIGAAIVQAL